MPKLWLFYFLFTIGVIGVFHVLFYFPLLLLSKILPFAKRWPDRLMRGGVKVLMNVQPWLKARIQIQTPETGRVLFVSNHRSHLDVFFLLSNVVGVRILARSTLFKIPFLGLMMKASQQIGVERGRFDAWVKAMATVGDRLRAGEKVHIFPEMTRCTHGFDSVQPFTAAPFLVAIQEDATVVPMVFRGTDDVWRKGEFGLHFRENIEVETLEPIRAREFANADALKTEVWKRIEGAL